MQSSNLMVRWRVALALLCVALVSACANYEPERLAYRDRLESGFITPEDVQRFRTPDAQRILRSADANEQMQLRAQPASVELQQAVSKGDVAALKGMLALPGVSVNATDEQGNSPLQLAAQSGNVEIMRVLLKAGADVNGRGGEMSPLAASVIHGQTQAVNLLLRQHAKVNQAGANGRTPLFDALELEKLDIAKLLLGNGADYRVLNTNGESVLSLAVRKSQLPMLDMLLRQGVPVDLRDREGHSALYWSNFYRSDEMSTLLRAHGANTDQMVLDVRPGRPYNTVEQ